MVPIHKGHALVVYTSMQVSIVIIIILLRI